MATVGLRFNSRTSPRETYTELRQETVRQALMFPRVYSAYLHYIEIEKSPHRVDQLRQVRLIEILGHALASVPFYRSTGIAIPNDATITEALERFPFVTKEQLRTSLGDFCDDRIDPDDCRYAPTSGTTGVPLKVIFDSNFLVENYAAALREKSRRGLDLHVRILIPLQPWAEEWFEFSAPAVTLGALATFGPPTRPADNAELARRAVSFCPDVLHGHPSRLVQFAQMFSNASIRPPGTVRVIHTFGERLTADDRALLENIFAAPVRDGYGMRETGNIAAECEAGRLHLQSERIHVEVVDKNDNMLPDGASGELVVTNLTNSAMPLVRYRTGDIGALDPSTCRCGLNYRVLSLLEGRMCGSLPLGSGRSVDLIPIINMIRDCHVDRHQIVRRTPSRIEVLVTPSKMSSVDKLKQLQQDLTQLLRPYHVDVRSVRCDEYESGGLRKMTDYVDLVDSHRE